MDQERPSSAPVACRSCGADNPADSTYCAYCGSLLPRPEKEEAQRPDDREGSVGAGPIGRRFSAPKAGFKRISVAWFLVLSVVTLGIYPSLWVFLRRRDFNSLSSTEKLSDVVAVLPLGVTLLAFATGSSLGENGQGGINLVCLGLWIWIAFKMRTMLRDHVAGIAPDYAATNVAPSPLWTVLFTSAYIQHQINRLIDADILRRTN
ncbi:DUF4234 domain-containing protein [Aminithiophilus ramosus]|uniref:DUF4234 domain-containing protein n=2 Tax=Synergistales TaxID=649776 RepID=A0A9Q7AC34_9BACT|nr:DUF4234 domain-containing protein [Aminithiophilus ramosus]QTX32223.1 DUF4234 domain-containing protein [Aminithiophilus ramosus]QVL36091.1 DUF4234 domain-containing protein [Synergistota bacterium]